MPGVQLATDEDLEQFWLCAEHSTPKSPPKPARARTCERCLAKEGKHHYRVADRNKLVCDGCWTALTGKSFDSTRPKAR